jgi:hypothetical protein
MPDTTYEELRLSIVLDDRVSTQLRQIQREVAAIGGGAKRIGPLHPPKPL